MNQVVHKLMTGRVVIRTHTGEKVEARPMARGLYRVIDENSPLYGRTLRAR